MRMWSPARSSSLRTPLVAPSSRTAAPSKNQYQDALNRDRELGGRCVVPRPASAGGRAGAAGHQRIGGSAEPGVG